MSADNQSAPMIQIPVTEYEALKEQTAKQKLMIAQLAHQVKVLQRARFGRSSEKLHLSDGIGIQLDLFGDAAVAEKSEPVEKITIPAHIRRKKRPVEDRFPYGLEPKIRLYGFEDNPMYPICGNPMRVIGRQQRGPDMLNIVPIQAERVRNMAAVWGCGHCEHEGVSTPIVVSKAPNPVIPRSFLTGGTLSMIAVDK